MVSARRWDFCIVLDCGDHAADRCRAFLPRRGPLGDVVASEYRPTGEWPATFLCVRHGRACVRLAAHVSRGVEAQHPGLPVPSLWRIKCVCGHEDCGMEHVIYVYKQQDWESILRGISQWNPEITCGSHRLIWDRDLMRGEEIPNDPGVDAVFESARGNQ
jgi:hypothetical protein